MKKDSLLEGYTMENKNKILVLGNGFDLSFSYDTRYADFINFIEFVQGKQEPKSWTRNFLTDV